MFQQCRSVKMNTPQPLCSTFDIKPSNVAHPSCLDTDNIKWVFDHNTYSYFIIKHDGPQQLVESAQGMDKQVVHCMCVVP